MHYTIHRGRIAVPTRQKGDKGTKTPPGGNGDNNKQSNGGASSGK
jgi:hypothetical protein